MDRLWRDRRHAQSGTTLVELLVSLVVIGLALILVIGVFSTALLDAAIAKRNTAAEAAVQYELDKVHASAFDPSAAPYSDCFATENPTSPQTVGSYEGACISTSFSLRADVTWTPGSSPNVQIWSISILSWPDAAQIGGAVSLVKVNR